MGRDRGARCVVMAFPHATTTRFRWGAASTGSSPARTWTQAALLFADRAWAATTLPEPLPWNRASRPVYLTVPYGAFTRDTAAGPMYGPPKNRAMSCGCL